MTDTLDFDDARVLVYRMVREAQDVLRTPLFPEEICWYCANATAIVPEFAAVLEALVADGFLTEHAGRYGLPKGENARYGQ